MANANENPELEVGFCINGTVIDIPESLRLLGVTPENPTIHGHVINKLFKMIFENLNHQKKKAISFWEPDEYYIATANNIDICRRNNKIYFCKQTHNDTGDAPKDPATNPDYWTILYDLDKPLFDEFAKYALKNGSSINLFKVKNAVADDEAVAKKQMEDFINNQTKFIDKKKDASGNVDLILTGGLYAYSSTLTNLPSGAILAGSLIVNQGINTSARSQILIDANDRMWIRYGDSSGWNGWNEVTTIDSFSQLLTTEGYTKLPNGLILQWGVTVNSTSGTETFPIAFPNACFGVQITNNNTNNSGFVSSFNTTSFTWSNLGTVTNRYLVIGY